MTRFVFEILNTLAYDGLESAFVADSLGSFKWSQRWKDPCVDREKEAESRATILCLSDSKLADG